MVPRRTGRYVRVRTPVSTGRRQARMLYVDRRGRKVVRWERLVDDSQVRGDGGVGAGPDRVEEPRWWVFTFGCGHANRGRYVRVFGTHGEARAEMVRRHGTEWAFQYSQEQWDEVTENLRANGWPVEVELKEEDRGEEA